MVELLYNEDKEERYHCHLRGLEIIRANHVWAVKITYILMVKGFCYLVAIMDWTSGMVLFWRLSNTMASPVVLSFDRTQDKHLGLRIYSGP